MINFIMGYIIIINITSMLFMYIEMKTDLIKLKEKWINLIYVILSIIGGSIGILITSRLLDYRKDEKLIKKGIPFIIFIEVVIIVYIIYSQNT